MLCVVSFTKHKSLEIELDVGRHAGGWFGFHLYTRNKTDHPGLCFTFELFTLLHFHLWFMDDRHWDDENSRYVNYEFDR